MIVERSHRFAAAVLLVVAAAALAVHVAVRDDAPEAAKPPGRPILASARKPVATAMPDGAGAGATSAPAGAPTSERVAAAPAETSPGAAAAALPAGPPAIPSVILPCVDETTELVADGEKAVMCWGERCLADPADPSSGVPRPPPAPAASPGPGIVVEARRVCTGARCDRLGPRLRAAVADAAPGQLSATRDHAAIVIGGPGESSAMWNRRADRRIDLEALRKPDEGEVVSVDVLGNRVIVARSCMEYCSAIARLVDARGRRRGRWFAMDPGWGEEPHRIVALDADHAVVFGRFGELTLLDHGRVAVSASLVPDSAAQPHEAEAQVVRLDDHTLAAQWCSGEAPGRACHLTEIRARYRDASTARGELEVVDLRVLPRCPVAAGDYGSSR
jgi:hypothetical protein